MSRRECAAGNQGSFETAAGEFPPAGLRRAAKSRTIAADE